MFVRRAGTRSKATSQAYFTHRLVASLRTGKQVRQVTLLNLGRHFLPQSDWPAHGIGQSYEITVIPDETALNATAITWKKTPVKGRRVSHQPDGVPGSTKSHKMPV